MRTRGASRDRNTVKREMVLKGAGGSEVAEAARGPRRVGRREAMAVDMGGRLVVGKVGRIQGGGGRTIIVIPMLVAVGPGTKRANESAVGGNNVGVH